MTKKLSPNASRKIVINGWYGHFNAGDDAILQVFVDQLAQRAGSEIIVLSEAPENIPQSSRVSSAFHLRPFSLSTAVSSMLDGELRRYLRNLKNCDLFVLGGGGILRDNTSWRNLVRILDEIWLSKLFGRKTMLYAIGVGPFKTRLGKKVIGITAGMCDLITVRSEKSAQLLHEAGVPVERIHVVADPAFLLQAEVPQDPELANLLAGGRKIGLFPALGLTDDGRDLSHAMRLAAALDRLVEKADLQFVALPMRFNEGGLDDVQLSHTIRSAMKHPEALHVYEKRLTPPELKWATGKTLMNITVRLHAMIFSLGAGIPVVPINYEQKVSNVFAPIGCPEYLVEMDENMEHALCTAVLLCLDNLPAYAKKIADSMASSEEGARRTFELMQTI